MDTPLSASAAPGYHRLARTDRYRWWRPLIELVLCVVLALVLVVAVLLPVELAVRPRENGAPGLLTLGLSIAILIPAALLAARIAGRPWRALLSVDGRVRWRWFGLCLAVALAEGVLSVVAEAVFAALGTPLGPARGHWVGWARFAPLAIAVLAAIVPQAAAEELVFRGTLVQALGAWVRPAWFAILLSSAAFGLVHALPLPGFVATATLGLVCAWLTIRTGGLEAAVALHVLHNVSYFLAEAATGRSDRWVTEINIDVRWTAAFVDVALTGAYAAAIALLNARVGPVCRGGTAEPIVRPGAQGEPVTGDGAGRASWRAARRSPHAR